MWTIFKVFIEFVTILLLFYLFFCFFWPRGMWDLSSPIRDRTHTHCTGRQSLNHWTTREVPEFHFFLKLNNIPLHVYTTLKKIHSFVDRHYGLLSPFSYCGWCCCYREEQNLATCQICFFYFNLCFPLLLFTRRILSIHNGLPRGTLPLCLNVKPKCLCSGKHPDPVHLWMATRKKKLTHPLPEAGHSRRYLQDLWPFYFTSSPPPPLCSMKETGIQTPIRYIFF